MIVRRRPFGKYRVVLASDELVLAIRAVAGGGMYLSAQVCAIVVRACLSSSNTPVDPLTSCERRVLQLVAEGKTTKEIATLLAVTTKSAETYRRRVMEKLNIHETAGLVRYAVRNGIIQATMTWWNVSLDEIELLSMCEMFSEPVHVIASFV